MSRMRFTATGYHIAEHFVPEDSCTRLLAAIDEYRKCNAVPMIHRHAKRPLHYSVIDGERIQAHLPNVLKLYQEVNKFVNEVSGQELTPLADEKVACNINITGRGGAYRWHYDRNAVTAILYLNEVNGGQTECYPNYRASLYGANCPTLQRLLDRLLQTSLIRRLFGKQVIVAPAPGKLLLMRGNRCLHSVCPVIGERERVNIIMSYDAPGACFAVAERLNAYLYSRDASPSRDPNYA